MGIILRLKFPSLKFCTLLQENPKLPLTSIVPLFLSLVPRKALGSRDRHLVWMKFPKRWTTVEVCCPGRLQALLAAQWRTHPRMQVGLQDNWGLMVHWRMAKKAACRCSGSPTPLCKSSWFGNTKHIFYKHFSPQFLITRILQRKCIPSGLFHLIIDLYFFLSSK